MTAVDRVLQALRDQGKTVQPCAGGHVAQCPAHDDQRPSLSVRGAAGKVLLFCQVGCATRDVAAALGLAMADLFDEQAHKGKPVVVAEYPYVDENGSVLFVKERKAPKTFLIKRPDGKAGWIYKNVFGGSRAPQRVLYRLPEVLDAIRDGRTVFVVEGEKDADRLAALGHTATCNFDGAAKGGQRPKWRPEYGDVLVGADVIVIADRDEAGDVHARAIHTDLRGKAKSVVVMRAKVETEHADVSDHLAAGYGLDELVMLDLAVAAAADESGEGGKDERGPSQASVVLALAREAYRPLMGDDGLPYAVKAGGPNIALPLRGANGLRSQLAKIYADRQGGRAPSSAALTDALTVFTGMAEMCDPEPVHLRVAEHGTGIVLDLGTADGRCVIIDGGTWQECGSSPVLFRRTKLIAPMPSPYRNGDLGKLRKLVNVDEDGWRVIVGYMIAAFIPDIPYPILGLFGRRGTAKSNTTRMIINTVSPSPAPTRAVPKDIKAWVTSTYAGWVTGIDNLSHITDTFSDWLCRASTGEGLIDRALYTDSDVSVISFRRPVIINGIELVGGQGDLANRLVKLELYPIKEYKDERELKAEYREAQPYALGALLDLTAQVLQKRDSVSLPGKVRMADFARVLAALDEVNEWDTLGWYTKMTEETEADSLSAFGVELRDLVQKRESWVCTPTQMWDTLVPRDSKDAPKPPKGWPTVRGLKAQLKRDLPALHAFEIEADLECRGTDRNRTRYIKVWDSTTCDEPEISSSTSSTSSETASEQGKRADDAANDIVRTSSAHRPQGEYGDTRADDVDDARTKRGAASSARDTGPDQRTYGRADDVDDVDDEIRTMSHVEPVMFGQGDDEDMEWSA